MNSTIDIDFRKVAEGFGLEYNTCINHFLDGRRIAFVIEQRIAQYQGWSKATSEKHPYDVVDPEGKKVEIRCVTSKVIFRPSSQIGAGRKFDADLFFKEKISVIDYYIFADINVKDLQNNEVHIFSVPSQYIWEQYQQGKLGKNAELARKVFMKLVLKGQFYGRPSHS